VRIQSGLDLNGDGILEANEVTETNYVCSGIVSLVNIVPEPAGHNCSAGGQAIQTGLDTNDDGILEAGEVQHTSYVCNGISGSGGSGGTGTADGGAAGAGGNPGTGGSTGTCTGAGVTCSTGKLGVCAVGTTACQNGVLVCVQDVQPSADVCDGLDNNCNGQIDEQFFLEGQSCTTGQGSCQAVGFFRCKVDKSGLVCDNSVYDPGCAPDSGVPDSGDGVPVLSCDLHFPTLLSLGSGVSSGPVYARVYSPGVTEVAGNQSEFLAQVGYGPSGSDPDARDAGWSWTPAVFNAACTDCGNSYEYYGTFAAPDPGFYAMAVRFSGDQGAHWTSCDAGGGAPPYNPANAGALTVQGM
jgi:hypothetical protein